jgi:hypothetical protein
MLSNIMLVTYLLLTMGTSYPHQGPVAGPNPKKPDPHAYTKSDLVADVGAVKNETTEGQTYVQGIAMNKGPANYSGQRTITLTATLMVRQQLLNSTKSPR